jgi:imidazolonepropionase-like amidohydrolase
MHSSLPQPKPVQVIRAGRLIDGTGDAAQHQRAVYIEDGTITAIGPASEIPLDANVLDLSGSTVLPGLIDCHVHLVFSASSFALGDVLAEDDYQLLLRGVAAARQALGAGITTVRDLGGRGGVTFRLRDAIANGLLAGPRILAAGSPITITGGHCHFLGLEADGEAGVRAAARGQLKAGANCLKIMATGGRMTPGTNIGVAQYSVDEIRAAVEEAQRRGTTLAAHALGTAGIRNATLAGVNTIEHCNWLSADLSVAFDESVAGEMARRGVAIVETLIPLFRSASSVRDAVVSCMRQAREMGVPFAAGTDAGTSLNPFDSLPSELEVLVRDVGFSPLQAIHAATGGAARALGIDSTLGTLRPGRAADLLAVDGDPAVDIGVLRSLRLVMKAGRAVVENGVVLS